MTREKSMATVKEEEVRRVRRGLAARIVGLRQRKGWSQEMLADRLAVPRERLAKWEAGKHAPPPEELIRLSEVLAVSLDELLAGRNRMEEMRRELGEHLAAALRVLQPES
jgi:transcriptional regulator with XRE-family HTH domain